MVLGVKDYAPVFIPTLCRDVHFKRCVDSLSKCTGAEFTTLIIGLDYPLKESHWDGYQKIKAYIPTISGFKKIEVLERSENYGALKNVVEAQKYIFERYETCIYSEDDNEFSPNFLEYINKGLVIYKDNPKVMSVCGYMYPFNLHIQRGNSFLGTAFSAWGVGEWREKKLNIDKSEALSTIDGILYSWKKSLKLLQKSPKEINSLIIMKTRELVWGDVLITSTCILEGKGSLFPVISKVRNWGDDGSGLHCKDGNCFSQQDIDTNASFDYDVEIDKIVYFTPHKLSLLIKITIFLRYFIFRLTNKDILAFHYKNRIV